MRYINRLFTYFFYLLDVGCRSVALRVPLCTVRSILETVDGYFCCCSLNFLSRISSMMRDIDMEVLSLRLSVTFRYSMEMA